jgi:hypothetical protein
MFRNWGLAFFAGSGFGSGLGSGFGFGAGAGFIMGSAGFCSGSVAQAANKLTAASMPAKV